MPRKYSGPLRKGERSAKVPKGKSKEKSALNKKEKKQVTKIVKKIVKEEKEVFHIQGYNFQAETSIASAPNYAQISPATIFRSGGRITMCGLCVGESLAYIANQCNVNTIYNASGTEPPRFQNTSGIRPMALNGVTGQNIEGEYGYQKAFNQKLKISVQPVRSTSTTTIEDEIAPMNFRCLVVRVRTNNNASKNTPTLDGLDTAQPSLFKDLMGQDIGLDTREVKTFEYENLKFNSEAFEKVRDIKFQLQRPYVYADNDVVVDRKSNIPAYKHLNINLKVPKTKIRYDVTTRLPVSGWNYVYFTMVFCSDAHLVGGNDYGTATGWCMEAQHESKFMEA